MSTPVYLEVGSKKVFACSLDWPGWCRSARTEEQALEALAHYAERYRPVAEEAGVRFPTSVARDFDVVERVKGNATTDFGAPGLPAGADATPLTKAEAGAWPRWSERRGPCSTGWRPRPSPSCARGLGATAAIGTRWWPTCSTPRRGTSAWWA